MDTWFTWGSPTDGDQLNRVWFRSIDDVVMTKEKLRKIELINI